ncbi:UNVERIFIED_CONTAM: protein argonaute 4 [Sesamum radiatum]|uniref:Protein argonaute 4 n=1 Tax=Sesamum radiatum TaxID=300843 RepID=A0AAW2W168_SESRA
MDPSEQDGNGAPEALPPPPPVPPNVTPIKAVSEPEVKKVALSYEDGRPVDGKGVGRKVLDRVHETYDTSWLGKNLLMMERKVCSLLVHFHGINLSLLLFLRMLRQVGVAYWFVNRFSITMRGTLLMLEVAFSVAEDSTQASGPPKSGLSLNIDVSTTMIIQPGPVADFLISNQNVRDLSQLTGRRFTLKQKSKDGDGEYQTTEVTVYDYFVNHRNIDLRYSADLPCINVGKPKRPTYFPIELCSLVSLQRYTKALSTFQRASLVEKSRQKPQERMSVLSNALKINNYDAEPMLRSCGVSISSNFTQVEGRVLPPPKLKVGNGEDLFARNGRWNFNNKKFVNACKIERWAVVNFSARCDVRNLVRDLMKVGEMKGISVEAPFDVFEENQQFRRAPPMVRVEKMFEEVQSKLPGPPKFLLCLLPERKNCDIYGPWKRKNLSDFGVVTQCLAPTRVNDQYLTNLLLKINAKLGGLNSMLAGELSPSIPMVSKVVSSRQWPSVSRYRACVRTQSPKVEMIDSLYKRVSDTEDDGIMRELLIDFYVSSGKRKPDQIIIFRDGVSESQFNQVLNIELNQIIEACKFLDENWSPKFVVIVAQKNHHTKFFRQTLLIMCSQGTTRPTHYHVLLDEVGFSADDLQELVHSLSYVYQRSTTAISVVAPICYAHLAATQLGQWMKFEDASETSSSHNGTGPGGAPAVPPMPKLQESVRNSMFFC